MASTFSDHSIKRLLDLSQRTSDTCTAPDVSQIRKRRRTLYPKRALDKMEAMFEENPYPTIEAREKLSLEFGVPDSKIQVWFQNRRTRLGRTKPRPGPRILADLKATKQQKQAPDFPISVAPILHPLAAYPYPHLMMSQAMILPTSFLDYSPQDWTSVWCSVRRPTVSPPNKLKDLLIGELRTYEANSSSSTTEDSQTNISV